jgi:protein-tyrosine-phosphatase
MKRVIFVCVENANRCQMAEAFARIHGGGKVESFSAGSRPSGRVNPKAVEAMKEVGYDLTAHQSKGLDDFNGQEFDAAVTMGCGDECPLVRAKRRVDWQIPDPKAMPPEQFREVRNLIEKMVKELLATVSHSRLFLDLTRRTDYVVFSGWTALNGYWRIYATGDYSGKWCESHHRSQGM